MDPTITSNHHHKPTTTTTSSSFLNGKKHQTIKHPHPYPHPLYRECLRNHAAALGGHAVDGCGEFMPSNSGSPTFGPSSLTCAACGCHRNFHRRLDRPLLLLPAEEDHRRSSSSPSSSGDEDDGDEGEEGHSGPHMLLALSTGVGPTGSNNGGGGGGVNRGGNGTAMGAAVCPPAMPERRKRFRSRFSPEQKGKMQELSERLGWRMQRRDEGIIEKGCREIGIGRGVFKVWMHNNKHNFASANAANTDANAANGGGGGGGGGESPA